ncbi:MAG: hypothetical protein AAGA56_09590, partial [Myxococcota bacterium]
PAPPPEPSGPPPVVTPTIDAEPTPMRGAIVEFEGREKATVTVSTRPLSCARGEAGEDEARIILSLVRRLGSAPGLWQVERLALTGPRRGQQRFDVDENAPTVGLPVERKAMLAVRATFNAPVALAGGFSVRVEFPGGFDATLCGEAAEAPPPPLAGDLQVRVGAETVAMAGATYRRNKKTKQHIIALSTQPLACDADLEGADLIIALALSRSGRKVEAISIAGRRLDQPTRGSLSGDEIRGGLRGRGKSVAVSLEGSVVLAERLFRFNGTALADLCR